MYSGECPLTVCILEVVVLYHRHYSVKVRSEGSHGGEAADVGLLGCNVMWTCR
jgi:hypothetical protein